MIKNNNKLISSSFNSIQWTDLAMIFFFASRAFTYIFTLILGSLGIFLTMGILAVLYLMTLIQAWKSDKRDNIYTFFLLVFTITFLAFLTMNINPEAKEWMLSFDYGLITRTFDPRKGVFAVFVILLVGNSDRIFNNLKISAWISFVYLSIHSVIFLVTKSWGHYFVFEGDNIRNLTYNMSFGYEMIFVSIIFLGVGIFLKKKGYLFMGALSCISAFIFGSRGIILPLVGFIFLLMLMKVWKNRGQIKTRNFKSKKTLLILLILIFASVFIFYVIKSQGGDQPFRTGIRNIDMLLSSNFTANNGRTRLWTASGSAIAEKFPLGYGVYGDRPFLGSFSRWGYSHNIFFELVISFGIFGVGIVLLLGYLTLKYLFSKKYERYSILILVFIAMNTKLLISDSFWYYEHFWALIGLYLLIELEANKNKAKRIKSNLLTGNKSFRPITLILSFIIIANTLIFGKLLYSEVQNQKYNIIEFNHPTVILALQDMDFNSVKLGLNELAQKGHSASAFVDTDSYSSKQIDELSNIDNIDLHLDLNKRPLGKENIGEILEYLNESRIKLTDVKTKPLAISTLVDVHPETLQFLRRETDALLLRNIRTGRYFKKSLTQNNMYKLEPLNASLNDTNYDTQVRAVSRQIDLAESNNSLIILYFRNIDIDPMLTNYRNDRTKLEYFNEIIELLESKDFEFMTVSQLLEEAYIPAEERTLRNLIINSDIVQKLISLVN